MIIGGTNVTVSSSSGVTTISSSGGSSNTFADSVVNTGGTVTLVNDSASPGASKYYGTNSGSTLGYFSLPTGTLSSVGISVPSFLNTSGSPLTTNGTITIGLSGTALPVANGGTGLATITANGAMVGNGTGAVQSVAPGTSGNVLTSNGTSWISQAAGGGVSFPLLASGGTVSAPDYSWSGGAGYGDKGFYSGATGEIDMAIGAARAYKFLFNTTTMQPDSNVDSANNPEFLQHVEQLVTGGGQYADFGFLDNHGHTWKWGNDPAHIGGSAHSNKFTLEYNGREQFRIMPSLDFYYDGITQVSGQGSSAGATPIWISVGGTANGSATHTPVSSSTTGETTLASYAAPAHTMDDSSAGNKGHYWGSFAANGDNKEIKFYVGTTVILDTGTLTTNGGSWDLVTETMSEDNSAFQSTTAVMTITNAAGTSTSQVANGETNIANTAGITFKVTGTAATSNGDILLRGNRVLWESVPTN